MRCTFAHLTTVCYPQGSLTYALSAKTAYALHLCTPHYGVLSSRVSNLCAFNKDCLCAAMSSSVNSFQIALFRQRDTAETWIPNSAAISLLVFPLNAISQAVNIVFVLVGRIVDSSIVQSHIYAYKFSKIHKKLCIIMTIKLIIHQKSLLCQIIFQ